MVDQLLKFITERLKKLPGFTLILILISPLYLRAFGKPELAWETAAMLALAWLAYRLGSFLDKPLYDSIFGPDRARRTLPIVSSAQTDLDTLRDNVVSKVFEPSNVRDYRDAVEKNKVTEKGNTTLYRRCEALLKPTKLWEQRVKSWLEVSKAARAMVVLAPIVAVLLALSSQEWPVFTYLQQRILTARQNLGVLGLWWVHIAVAVTAIPVFLATRYRHHHRLYSAVKEKVVHVSLLDGRLKAEILEDPLIVR